MQMISVDSSDLASVGYEGTTLHILFNSGGLYAYYGVPASIYNGLMGAGSKGKYFHTNIKGKYGDTKIG